MSRKSKLIKEYSQYLIDCDFGSPQTQKAKSIILKNFTNDLIRLGIAPTSFAYTTSHMIQQVIDYWKQKHISSATVKNRLSILRKFFNKQFSSVNFPNNTTLSLYKEDKQELNIPLNQSMTKIRDSLYSLSQSILDFQLHFGLTKTESIRLNRTAFENYQIHIDRKTAINNRDRYIPICNTHQNLVIETRLTLLGKKQSLTELGSSANIRDFFKMDCLLKNIPYDFPFRSYYVKHRYNALTTLVSSQKAIAALKLELGLVSTKKIEELLYYGCQ